MANRPDSFKRVGHTVNNINISIHHHTRTETPKGNTLYPVARPRS